MSLCVSIRPVYVSVCALVCVPSWPRVIFRVVTLHLGEGGLGLLGSVKGEIIRNSFSKNRFPSARRTALSVKCSGSPLFPGVFKGGQGFICHTADSRSPPGCEMNAQPAG